MKKMKWMAVLSMATLLSMSLAACGSKKTEKPQGTSAAQTASGAENEAQKDGSGRSFKIGVLQLVQHPALDAANKGFIQALDDSGISYTADQQNASGEQSSCQTIADKFVNDGKDLIYAIATPAAQAASAATTEIPIVIAAVTDPAASGLVASNDSPGGNVTGASDLTPVREQIELLTKVIPGARRVGVLYCTAESNSEIQAELAHKALKEKNLEYKDYTVSSTNEIQTVVESMIGNVDAIYIPTDNTIANGMSTVAQVANDNKIPTVCGESGLVDKGGLITYGLDYYELGYSAGQQAVEILKNGKKPGDIPILHMDEKKLRISYNEDTAKLLGIDITQFEQK